LKDANKGLTPFQIRSRLPFFTLSLFDEALHTPLLFVGKNIKHELISNQVSGVDIFPTITNLIGCSIKEKIHGQNLLPFPQKSGDDESAIYLHTIPYEKTSPEDKVGIRTPKYKYFRAEIDKGKEINLYDLENDPQENNNIASENPEIVKSMEEILEKLTKNVTVDAPEKLTENQEKIIEKQLKEMGYI
jgi:arylsulfatase A-like enzyme